MELLRKIIFFITLILLGWLFLNTFPEFDLARVKNQSYFREQISEIENSNSIKELKEISKSKVITIQEVHKNGDERQQNIFYIVIILIVFQLFLYITRNKKGNSKLST